MNCKSLQQRDMNKSVTAIAAVIPKLETAQMSFDDALGKLDYDISLQHLVMRTRYRLHTV